MAYKDNSIKKWVGDINYKDLNGKSRRKRKKGFKTKKEALEWEIINKDKYTVREVDSRFLTFGELKKSFLDSAENKKKQTTIKRYKTHLNMFNELNDMNVNIISMKIIENIQQRLLLEKYSINSINNAKTVLGAVFNHGIDYYGLTFNPSARVKPLKNYSVYDTFQIITLEQFEQFISVVDDLVYKTLFSFLFFTGVRKGEAFALNWHDIDLAKATISISKSLNNDVKNQPYEISTPKTKNSIRTFQVNDDLISLLNELKDKYIKYDSFNDNWFVFGGIKPLKNTTVGDKKNMYFKKAKLEPIKIHEFRHSHASLLINNGVSIDIVKRRLGHSSVATTLDIYGALYKERDNEVTDLLNGLTSDRKMTK